MEKPDIPKQPESTIVNPEEEWYREHTIGPLSGNGC